MKDNLTVTGLDEMIEEVGRIGDGPTPATRAKLDGLIAAQFADTQSKVHVETGALKASGRVTSEYDPVTMTWEGQITYGRENDPAVDYALYHMSDDSSHDFFRGLPAFEVAYGEVVEGHFER